MLAGIIVPLSFSFLFSKASRCLYSPVTGGRYLEEKRETNHYKLIMRLHVGHLEQEDFISYQCVCRNTLGAADGTVRLYRTYAYNIKEIPKNTTEQTERKKGEFSLLRVT